MLKRMSSIVCAIFCISMLVNSGYAEGLSVKDDNIYKISAFSPMFPDAYVETSYDNVVSDQVTAFSADSDRKLVGNLSATVYVEETYDNGVCTSSRLLSKEEVDSKIQLFSGTPGDTEEGSHYKLTMTFSVYEVNSSNAVDYELVATAHWNAGPLLNSGESRPSHGYDYMGFTWGGGHSMRDDEASGTANTGDPVEINIADVSNREAIVWGFIEQLEDMPSPYLQWNYAKDLYATVRIYKKTSLTGEDCSAMFKYIHTYDDSVTSLSSVNITNKGTTSVNFSLDTTTKQWPLILLFNQIHS